MMIPMGYMAKRIVQKPEWVDTPNVVNIYSISDCNGSNENFCDYIQHWKHNGYWLPNSPKVISEIAENASVDLSNMQFFYYEAYELEYDPATKKWLPFKPDDAFPTNVEIPRNKKLEGYDIVNVPGGGEAENQGVMRNTGCSVLVCGDLASVAPVNPHCLLASLEEAKKFMLSDSVAYFEPDSYRILAVYTVSP